MFKSYFCCIILTIGITLCSFFLGFYYYQSKKDCNTVIVKGLAEMNVTADLAIWKLKFITTENDLNIAQQKINQDAKEIIKFLKAIGFKNKDFYLSQIETNDLKATPYHNYDSNSSRFILSQTVTIRSTNVALVQEALTKANALIEKNIIFDNSYGENVSYIFTKLNEIKPQMLEEAIKNAAQSAKEFAKNSHSKVGKIHRANQGIFTILPREPIPGISESQQIEKTIRVVSTIEYWLK